MKKTLFYLFSVFMLGVGFTSCLGDTESSTSGSYYAVIKSGDLTLPAQAWVMPIGLVITWDGISKYNAGDVIFLSYDVDLNNQKDGVIYADASKIQVDGSNVFSVNDQKRIVTGEGVADTSVVNNPHKFEVLQLKNYYPTKHFDDKWIFYSKFQKKEGQIVNFNFYYDTKEGMQHTAAGADLPADAIVVDIKLDIKNDGEGTAKSVEQDFVVDFSRLRDVLFANENEQKVYNILFRYYGSKDIDKPSYVNMGQLGHIPETSN